MRAEPKVDFLNVASPKGSYKERAGRGLHELADRRINGGRNLVAHPGRSSSPTSIPAKQYQKEIGYAGNSGEPW
jgi:hypothetical protein